MRASSDLTTYPHDGDVAGVAQDFVGDVPDLGRSAAPGARRSSRAVSVLVGPVTFLWSGCGTNWNRLLWALGIV
jgi:hypothetical protein